MDDGPPSLEDLEDDTPLFETEPPPTKPWRGKTYAEERAEAAAEVRRVRSLPVPDLNAIVEQIEYQPIPELSARRLLGNLASAGGYFAHDQGKGIDTTADWWLEEIAWALRSRWQFATAGLPSNVDRDLIWRAIAWGEGGRLVPLLEQCRWSVIPDPSKRSDLLMLREMQGPLPGAPV